MAAPGVSVYELYLKTKMRGIQRAEQLADREQQHNMQAMDSMMRMQDQKFGHEQKVLQEQQKLIQFLNQGRGTAGLEAVTPEDPRLQSFAEAGYGVGASQRIAAGEQAQSQQANKMEQLGYSADRQLMGQMLTGHMTDERAELDRASREKVARMQARAKEKAAGVGDRKQQNIEDARTQAQFDNAVDMWRQMKKDAHTRLQKGTSQKPYTTEEFFGFIGQQIGTAIRSGKIKPDQVDLFFGRYLPPSDLARAKQIIARNLGQ